MTTLLAADSVDERRTGLPRIHFVGTDGETQTVEAQDGWTVMETAINNGVEGILADCGGACSCATCHVYVDAEWLDRLPPRSESEADMIECVPEPRPTSRLSCQIRIAPGLDGLRVEVPEDQL